MSKAGLVVVAVRVQHRSVAEVARCYGVDRSWIYKLLKRFDLEGEAGLEPRSRRPKFSPSRTGADVVACVVAQRDVLVKAGHDAGPETIGWHLQQAGLAQVPSRSTIARILSAHGKVRPAPEKKPKAAYRRFVAEQPNECWQSDFTHYRLADGADCEIITWLDDHSRYALHISAYRRITGPIVLATFRCAATVYGWPASTLTDNGMVYTTRFSGGKGGKNGFEVELQNRGITQKNTRPNHPTTTGKVERFQQTLKKWLRHQPNQPATIEDLQTLLNEFRSYYNTKRPHRGINRRIPTAAYTSLPPANPRSEPTPAHTRIRTDTIDKAGKVTLRYAGKLYHIGIGRAWTRQPVKLLVNDRHITISHATTGELLRELTLDPTTQYQPQNT